MKIIIQDYTTNHCSQSRLLFAELQKHDNIQPFFWSDQDECLLTTLWILLSQIF